MDQGCKRGSRASLLKNAKSLFYKAAEIDPGFASAVSWIGATYTQRQLQGWTTNAKRDAEEALRCARLAVQLTKEDAWVMSQSAWTLGFFSPAEEFDTATSLIERALQLNPNVMFAWMMSGWFQLFSGFSEVAIEHHLRALKLSPIEVFNFFNFDGIARANFLLGRLDEARRWVEKALTENPRYLGPLRTAAAIEAAAGNLEKARHFAERIFKNNPDHATTGSTTARLMRNEDQRRKWVEALRLAGLSG